MKRDHTSVEVMLKYNDSLIESVFDWCLIRSGRMVSFSIVSGSRPTNGRAIPTTR